MKSGNLYAWGLNHAGQLGTGVGTGKDMTEIEKMPLKVVNDTNVKFVDFACGENTMLIKDTEGNLWKCGLKLDYTPSQIELSISNKPKQFFSGRSFYCMIDGENNVYQWGNLFDRNSTDKKDENDMHLIKSKEIFGNMDIVQISSKFTLSGALLKEKI